MLGGAWGASVWLPRGAGRGGQAVCPMYTLCGLQSRLSQGGRARGSSPCGEARGFLRKRGAKPAPSLHSALSGGSRAGACSEGSHSEGPERDGGGGHGRRGGKPH